MEPHASKFGTPCSTRRTPTLGCRCALPGQGIIYAATQVPSTKPLTSTTDAHSWREAGLPFYSYNHFLRQRFGGRVQKVSLDAGFTCPNVDGTVAKGGCTFCDNRSFSPSRRLPRAGVLGQIDQSIARMR